MVVGTLSNMGRLRIIIFIINHNFYYRMEKKIDKRTKAYKDSLKKSEGLGDTIEKVTKATGIKKVVEWLTDGKDCGCDKRKAWLNEKFRYKAECLVKSEYDYLKEYNKRHNPKRFERSDVKQLLDIHRRTLGIRPSVCLNCNSGVKVMNDVVKHLNELMEAYEI